MPTPVRRLSRAQATALPRLSRRPRVEQRTVPINLHSGAPLTHKNYSCPLTRPQDTSRPILFSPPFPLPRRCSHAVLLFVFSALFTAPPRSTDDPPVLLT